MQTAEYFNLAIPAPKRLAMLRKAFASHATQYPHCPAGARPQSWRDIRRTTHKGLSAYTAALGQGFNGTNPVWYCHTGPQFRDEKFADKSTDTIEHTGWFTDTDQDEKARGIVARLSHGRFIAGYHWSTNGERVYFPDIFTDETRAAEMADEHARVFAESAMEHSERYEAMALAELARDEKLIEVQKAFVLRHDERFGGRDSLESAIEELREARKVYECAVMVYERG